MTDISPPPESRYSHLHAHAKRQKQATVERLKNAITQLQHDGCPVNTFTIREVSGLDYMAYYRNPEAFALFQQHSTHLGKEREKQRAKQGTNKRSLKEKGTKFEQPVQKVAVKERDPMLDYKKPRLVALVHEARTERDQVEQRVQSERADLAHRYHVLLQEHMQCGLKIVGLEAQIAKYQVFMEQFRSSLNREEHGRDLP